MIKVIMERPIPPGFDPMNDAEAARHCRIAVDAMTRLGGAIHWVCSYATEDRLFGVVVVDSEETLQKFHAGAGMTGQSIKVHRVKRVLDASMAAP
jgi:hypothetical protein